MPVKSLSQNISQAKEYGGSPCGLLRTVLTNCGGPPELTKVTNPCLTSLCVTHPVAALAASPHSGLCRAAHSNEFLQFPCIFLLPQTTQKEKLTFFDIVPKDLPEICRISCLALTVMHPSFEASTLQSSSSVSLIGPFRHSLLPTAVVSQ